MKKVRQTYLSKYYNVSKEFTENSKAMLKDLAIMFYSIEENFGEIRNKILAEGNLLFWYVTGGDVTTNQLNEANKGIFVT